MSSSDRRTRLLARLDEEGRASVDALAHELGVTPSTIRRDLARLSADGTLVRTYGGAAAGSPAPGRDPLDPQLAAKRAIGAAAAELVQDGQTIAISSGTTALELARRLVDRRLTVITNALDVVGVLLDRPGIELVVLGGVVRPGMHSSLGHLAELALRELRADTLFMGIGALSAEHGLMNDSIPEILTDRALRRASRACVVLADSSKLGAVAPAYVFGIDEVDTLVTDGDADPAGAQRARGAGRPGHPRDVPGKEHRDRMIEGIIPAEILDEPAAIRDTLSESLEAARAAAAALRRGGVRRVHVIGNGTSYHSSLAAATLYRRHAGPDDPIVVPLTAGEFRTYRPRLGPGDAVLGISASGEFRDVVGAFEELRGRVPTVAVVHVPGSTLDGLADHVVRSSGGPSHVPVMTKTFAATLVATELVLAELLGGDRAADDPAGDTPCCRPRRGRRSPPPSRRSRPSRTSSAEAEHLFVVGSGGAWPAALEAALKLKEMAIVHAEGTESWEMASGVATIVDARSVVIALAPHGPRPGVHGRRRGPCRGLGRARHRGGTRLVRGRCRAAPRSRPRPRRTTRR